MITMVKFIDDRWYSGVHFSFEVIRRSNLAGILQGYYLGSRA